MADASTIVVIAKEPVPGRAKTRLSPPLSARQASEIAAACLRDTLDAVAATGAARRVIAWDGDAAPESPPGFEVLAQRPGGLDERLAGAFEDVGETALLIGMDTPQVTPELLDDALADLAADGVDAVLGLTYDGGYWAIGLGPRHGSAIRGVPMSEPHTGERQLSQLMAANLRTRLLPQLRDLDYARDARDVAVAAPQTRFARAVEAMGL